MKLIKFFLPISILGLMANLVFAAEPLESVLVTGTYTPVPLTDLSSSVSILDQEFLRNSNKRNVADVLRTVPGLLIEELGGAGGLTSISIRGGEANFTLVLVDGVQLNDPNNTRGGSFDFSNLDMASIERIEIVRGPQSAIYGSDGLAGVINIITRRSTQEHQQYITAERGEDDYGHIAAGATGSLGDFGYALQLARHESGESTSGSERDNDEFNLGLDWSPSESQELKMHYRYLDGERSSFPEQSGGPEHSVTGELDYSTYTDETLSAGWGWQVLPAWHSNLEASRFKRDEDYSSPGIFPYFGVPPQLSTTEFTRDQLRWVNDLSVGDKVHIAVGADYRDEEGDSTGELDFGFFSLPTDFSLDRSTMGVFLDARAWVLPALLLHGSARYDDPDEFDSETTLKLGAKYNITQRLSLLANWGEAFKLPSFFALGHALVGNPDLLPETGESWDLGLQWAPSERLALEATYFFNEYTDLIDFDSELFTNVNRRRVDTSGTEVEFNWQITEALNLLGHAAYTDIEVKGDAAPLLGRPDWTAGTTALWQVSAKWRAALDYQWTGEQFASSRYTGDTVIEKIDDYHRLNMNVGWEVLKWATVELAVDNILDEDYDTAVGFPGSGRSVRLGLTLRNL